MKQSAWIAIGLLAATAAWIASGYIVPSGEDSEDDGERAQAQPTLVEVQHSKSRSVERYVFAQGSAQPFRTLDLTVEAGGTIEELDLELGDVIEADAVVGRVALDERAESRQSAETRLETLEEELDRIRQLEAGGTATQSEVRELEAQVEEARAALAQINETVKDTTVASAIPGVVNAVYVNEGQTVAPGSPLATVIDNSPLRVELQVAQTDVGRVERGTVALVNFATGHSAKGRVCFIAPTANEETQTFLVEVRVANEDRAIPSGISAELRLDAGEVEAHFASPAILSLNEQGELGIKAVGEGDRVDFYPAEIVRSDPEGVWLAGLPDELDIIAVGQGFVRPDEPVRMAQAPQQENGAPQAEAAPGNPAAAESLPTASVQAQEFEGAGELAEPPPADEICALRGADAAGLGTGGAGAATLQAQPVSGSAAPATGSSPEPSSTGTPPTDTAPAAPEPTSPQPPATTPAPNAAPTAPSATPPAPAGPEGGAVQPVQPFQPVQPGGSQAPPASGGAP